MAIAITTATHTAVAVETQTASAAKSATASPKPAAPQAALTPHVPTDTVKISTAAQTALQEATETQAQTAKEAGHGDRQAVKLLAKEVAEKKA
jgi:hypothetical protein